MSTLTPALIKDIAERAEKATAGKWCVDGFHTSAVIVEIDGKWKRVADCDTEHFKNANWYADAQFVAHAHQDIPALLAHITALEKERDEARAAVQKTHDELYWCAEQLKHHGRPGRPGDSVSVALDAAKAVIRKTRAALTPPQET